MKLLKDDVEVMANTQTNILLSNVKWISLIEVIEISFVLSDIILSSVAYAVKVLFLHHSFDTSLKFTSLQ